MSDLNFPAATPFARPLTPSATTMSDDAELITTGLTRLLDDRLRIAEAASQLSADQAERLWAPLQLAADRVISLLLRNGEAPDTVLAVAAAGREHNRDEFARTGVIARAIRGTPEIGHAARIANRIDELARMLSEEEGGPLLSESVLGFFHFLCVHRTLCYPDITVGPDGEMCAQWKAQDGSALNVRFMCGGQGHSVVVSRPGRPPVGGSAFAEDIASCVELHFWISLHEDVAGAYPPSAAHA